MINLEEIGYPTTKSDKVNTTIDTDEQATNIEQDNHSVEKDNKKPVKTFSKKLVISGIISAVLIAIIYFVYENNKMLELERQEKARIELAEKVAKLAQNSYILSPTLIANLVKCPTGSFIMGSQKFEIGRDSDEKPHRVTISKTFYISKYEVTQKEYETVMGENPSSFKGENYPVESVSWIEAKDFCKKLNEIYKEYLPSGYQFDLPTEAQWEYACRAGTTTALNNGEYIIDSIICQNLDQVAWYFNNSNYNIHVVGQKKPNEWGIFDMHGNVWEWCRDWYGGYQFLAVTDPTGPNIGSDRVIRGGCWDSFARFCRSASRRSYSPARRFHILGFRLALVPIVV